MVKNLIIGVNTQYLSPKEAMLYEIDIGLIPLSNQTSVLFNNLTGYLEVP